MQKEKSTPPLSSRNPEPNYNTLKNETILDKFTIWFRNFLDNAE
ncbi:MAG: hypothetical protein P8H93_05425 [Polaribacter sp.]|jgi:hypothetical protein|nr:hypothetical protein [Polaribacter sp.]